MAQLRQMALSRFELPLDYTDLQGRRLPMGPIKLTRSRPPTRDSADIRLDDRQTSLESLPVSTLPFPRRRQEGRIAR